MQAPLVRNRLVALAAAMLLAACSTAPVGGPRSLPLPPAPGRDGPQANPPADLDKVADAEPRVEPVRPGGPNKPYEQSGRQYVPLSGDPPFREKGLASWYGRKFHGRPTASGELYNMYAMTAAHPTLPIPSYVRVRNPANGREVIVRVNDRGPFHSDRIIDLSYTAALKLDLLKGVRPVEIERITYEDIRTGAWKRDATQPGSTMLGQAAPAAPKADPVAAQPVPVPPAVAVAAAEPGAPLAAPSPSAAAPDASIPPPPAPAPPAPRAASPGFWIQLGAFRQASGALDFQRRIEQDLDWLAPLLAVFKDGEVRRLQAGPYRTRSEADSAAQKIRSALQLVPVVVERR